MKITVVFEGSLEKLGWIWEQHRFPNSDYEIKSITSGDLSDIKWKILERIESESPFNDLANDIEDIITEKK